MGTRRERVVLELDDQFTAGTLRAAAAAKVLDHELDGVGRQTRVVNDRQNGIPALSTSSNRASSDLDRFSGRLSFVAHALGAVAPAAVPITTAVVPALAAMATGLAFSAAAAGTAVIAFQGVGDAVTALQKYNLEPTTANLVAFQKRMDQLSPSAQALVLHLREMGPELRDLRDAAADGIFPGVIRGMDELEGSLPGLEKFLHTVGDATGDLFAASAKDLAGPGWSDFFDYLQDEARPTLISLGHTAGDFAHGLANLWMALDPLSDSALGGLESAAAHFEDWTAGLDQTEGFQEFLDYVRDTGPQVLDTVQALGSALLQIGEAAAPLGGPVLQALEGIARAVALIADSPLGPPLMAAVTAMSALRLATMGWEKVSKTAWATNMAGAQGYMGQVAATRKAALLGAGALGFLAVNATGVDEKLGLTNTTMLGMAGLMVGGPWGLAIGAGIGGLIDFADANNTAEDAVRDLNDAIAKGNRADILREQAGLVGDLQKATSGNGLGVGLRKMVGQVDTLTGGLSDAGSALIDLDFKGRGTSRALSTLAAPALGDVADEAGIATSNIEGLARGFEHLGGVLDRRAALRDYRAALRAVNDALKQNGRTLDTSTAKGDANQAVLDRIAAVSLKVADTLKGTNRIDFLAAAKKSFEDAAVKLGKTRKAAEDLADRLFKFDGKTFEPHVDLDDKRAQAKWERLLAKADEYQGLRPDPTIDANVDPALSALVGLTEHLNVATRPRTIFIRVATMGGLLDHPIVSPSVMTPADGGTVPKTGLPYADRHPALLADGEEVISNRYGQADRHRSLLKAINANRMADGGTAGGDAPDDGSDSSGVHKLGKEARRAAKALRAEREERQKHLDLLKQMREQLVSSVRDQFRESPFDVEGSPWASGAGNWRRNFRTDIADARAFSAAEVRLKKRGLTGGALSYLLQNADPDTVQAFSHYSRAELAQYEHLYRVRQRVSGSAGRYAGDTAYGAQIDRLERELRAIHHELRHRHPQQTGKAAGKALTGAARTGARNAK